MGKRIKEVLEVCGRVLRNQAGVRDMQDESLEGRLAISALVCVGSAASNCGPYIEGKVAAMSAMSVGWMAGNGKVGKTAGDVMKKLCVFDVEDTWTAVDRYKEGEGVVARKVRGLMEFCETVLVK